MSKIIVVFPMFNTGGICVHAIDDAEDKVLASVNGENPEWCEMLNSRRKMARRWSRACVRLLFRAVLRGHARVNLN